MDSVIENIKDAAVHGAMIDDELFFSKTNSVFSVRAKRIFSFLTISNGLMNERDVSKYVGKDRTSIYHYTRSFCEDLEYDPYLKKAYNEALNYIKGAPTPLAELIMRANNEHSKSAKHSYVYIDTKTKLRLHGVDVIKSLYGVRCYKGNKYLENRFKLTDEIFNTKWKKVKDLTTRITYDNSKEASKATGDTVSSIQNHAAKKILFKRKNRRWAYV